jgi:hypothetical protein
MKKIKAFFLKYWISFEQSWARTNEIHKKIEEQKEENRLKYQNRDPRIF